MREKGKHTTTQLFNFTNGSYLERTSRPVYAIAFLVPFIFLYEIGTLLINTDILNQTQVRVVAFVWLQRFLEYLGAGSKVAWAAPPLVVIIILIGLQLASRKKWDLNLKDIGPMAVECTFLAVPLIVLSLFLNSPSNSRGYTRQLNDDTTQYGVRFSTSGTAATKASESSYTPAINRKTTQPNSLAASIVTGIGAGIYEELVFRLILICTLMLVFQDILGISHQNSIILSVLVSAALFSAHHHVVYANGHFETNVPFTWTEFGFRTIAGIYFAGLFAIRGFGIAAGTHAFYDIIATIINAVFFEQ
jgi:hypothetical protein